MIKCKKNLGLPGINKTTEMLVTIMASIQMHWMAAMGCFGRLSLFFLLIELFDGLDLFFELHSSILEPDFNLSLREA